MAVTRKRGIRPVSIRWVLRLMSRVAVPLTSFQDFNQTERTSKQNASLKKLMFAAMALPGLMMHPASAAEGDAVSAQYGLYQEGERNLAGVKSKFDPIQAESIHGGVKFTLTDFLKGALNFSQDAWSGATPIATAPLSARGNRISATHVMTGASVAGVHIHDPEGTGEVLPAVPHGMTGASPYLYSTLKLDGQYRPLLTDNDGAVVGGVDTNLVHTMSSASREIRQQIDFNLSRELNRSTVDVGGGLSRERDFDSLFGNVGGRWDFNRKLTTLNTGISYTYSTTHATLDHDAVPHIYEPYMFMYERRGDNSIYNNLHSTSYMKLGQYSPTLYGKREDWGMNLGVTQILNKGALLKSSVGYVRNAGYLSNPYKAVEVVFVDPLLQKGQAGGNPAANYVYDAQVVALMDQRPDLRNQGTLNLRYVQHIDATDAALRLDYRYFQDDWGIKSQTLETQWVQPLWDKWTISPRLRYYTQTAADFYTPYLTTRQGVFSYVTDPVNGPIYINTQSPTNGIRYYEDQTGAVTPPIDPNPASRNYGQPVVGLHGAAVINQQTGLPVNDQTLVDALKQDTLPFDRKKLPAYYSSDPRLSGFGALSAGITVSRRFSKGIKLEFGYERMKHASALKLNGGGSGSYADYSSYLLNVALTIDLDSAGRIDHVMGDDMMMGDHMMNGHTHHASGAPAGVMFDHMLENKGDVMVGYRYMYGMQGGDILRGRSSVDDYTLINRGCDVNPCYVRPTAMGMRMHMLDIMYAPNDWINLMLMPQFMEMDMSMRLLDGSPRTGGHDAIGMAITHSSHPHNSAGLGDTEMHALFRLLRKSNSKLHLGLGLSAPTGDVGVRMRDMMAIDMGFMDYGMQLGSGTWDFKPSLTYTGGEAPLLWGAQISGTKRLQDRNQSGYSLGDMLQATAWQSYGLGEAWSASVRGLYTWQGPIRGEYNDTIIRIGPGDYTGNYGGRFLDLGLGLSAMVKSGTFTGNRLGVEWLQPVLNNTNGYRLKRTGTLVFSWGVHF